MSLRLKDLEIRLGNLESFETPKLFYEQYPTSPHIAACILHTAESRFGDIAGQRIGDFGVGTGVLSIGASLLGAGSVLGVDIDSDALRIAATNLQDFELSNVDLLNGDVRKLREVIPGTTKPFDTILMNPPFGTKGNKGIDIQFLSVGLALANNSVISLHKSSTRNHILKKAKEWKVHVETLAQLRYDLPASYSHHRQKTLDIDVDLFRFSFKS